jgi:predicted dehydrogenase
MPRRDPLAGSAKLAPTAAVALDFARSAHAAGDDTIRIALIGCGSRGTGAAADCLGVPDQIKLVAVADAFEDRARAALQAIQQRFGDQVDVPQDRIFVGFDAYLQALQCEADLVILATPPGFRPIHYRAAIEAGRHVFSEKPCCVDAPGFRSLMETNKLADQKKCKVAVGLILRHTPHYVESVKRIHEGAIGPVSFLCAYGNGPGVWVRPRQPGQTEMQYQMRNWYYFMWLSGDFIAEQHVHMLDLANWANGDQHPVEANGMGGRQVRKGKDFGHIFDHHAIEYTYANGSKLFSQCRHSPNCWYGGGVQVRGPAGTADCGGWIEGARPWKYTGPSVSGHRQAQIALIRSIREDLPHNEGYYGATSSFTAVLGRMATYSGQVVRWDDAVAEGPNEMPDRFAWDAPPPVLPGPDGGYEHAVPVPGNFRPY